MRIPSNSPDMIRNPNLTAEENERNESSRWSAEDNKIFERALALYDKNSADYLQKVAAAVPGKTIGDVKRQIEVLMEDIQNIEAGFVVMPNYDKAIPGFSWDYGVNSAPTFQVSEEPYGRRPCPSMRYTESGRKKGVPWTEEEHRSNKVYLYSKDVLVGLEKCGKGDWRTISRVFVVTRTPTQIIQSSSPQHFNQSFPPQHFNQSSPPQQIIQSSSPQQFNQSSSPQQIIQSLSTQQFNQSCSPQQFNQSSSPQQFNHSYAPQQIIQSSSTQQFNQSSSTQQFNQSCSPQQFNQSYSPQQFNQSCSPQQFNHSSSTQQFNQSCSPQQFNQSYSPEQFNQSFPPPHLVSHSSSPQQFHHHSSSPSQFQWSQQQHNVGGVVMDDALGDVPAHDDGNNGTLMLHPYVSQEFKMSDDQMRRLDDLVRLTQSQNMRRNGHAV
ncbi:transcription factor DIVARICATA-like [Senna tora]|uniref:Transcription factor DIVARICATA-like n=1 Tax=Senna tora TaxID=362788 RepID=A0A834SCD0_9FABA|nr:transcription factor DIVARICATA-like [Senna tora]